MKTLKKFFICFEIVIKNFFFNAGNVSTTNSCGELTDEKNNFVNDVESIRQEEYISKYKSTTRWQTV